MDALELVLNLIRSLDIEKQVITAVHKLRELCGERVTLQHRLAVVSIELY